MVAPTIPFALFRDTPDRPERPERERWTGPGRWFYVTLAVFVLLLVLNRLLGPVVVAALWATGLVVYLAIRGIRAWKHRNKPKP